MNSTRQAICLNRLGYHSIASSLSPSSDRTTAETTDYTCSTQRYTFNTPAMQLQSSQVLIFKGLQVARYDISCLEDRACLKLKGNNGFTPHITDRSCQLE